MLGVEEKRRIWLIICDQTKQSSQRIFNRCAAVVRHGGAGTSQTATRSGCPSVVVPFMDEQLFWARQLQALGVAGKPLPAKK
ncbi:MAG: glycosyltransferase [Burkholderiaceae bacterium]